MASTEREHFYEHEDKLLFFAYNLAKFVEVTLESCSDIVGGSNPVSLKRKSSLKDQIIFATQFLGLGLKPADGLPQIVENGFKMYENGVLEMKKSKLSWLIYEYYCDKKIELRSEIVRAAIDIFAHYEPQFKHVTQDKSGKKAMQILAFEASFRLFSHMKHLDVGQLTIDKDLFVKCIINAKGKSLNYRVTYKTSPKVIYVQEIFDEVGVFDNNEKGNIYYKKSQTKLLGYRKKFNWEKNDENGTPYPEDDEYCKQFYLLCNEDLMKRFELRIKQYIIEKDPMELNQHKSQQFHQEQMDDRKNKHDELMNYLKNDINNKLERMLNS